MASANPATMPVGSAVGSSLTVYTVPDVPIDTTTSRERRPTPSAPAMLSPVPDATVAPCHSPAISPGPSTVGTTVVQSRSASTTASRSGR